MSYIIDEMSVREVAFYHFPEKNDHEDYSHESLESLEISSDIKIMKMNF
ncbi:MAG: hypothetical protein LBE92_10410 [Chryseobacterium sp.]|jgi:hypothetical protein|nr:hypothetical protein [Chryseobacterium sp.]MDR2236528.1 hypothetical protein [Chryseobacterium sp.]